MEFKRFTLKNDETKTVNSNYYLLSQDNKIIDSVSISFTNLTKAEVKIDGRQFLFKRSIWRRLGLVISTSTPALTPIEYKHGWFNFYGGKIIIKDKIYILVANSEFRPSRLSWHDDTGELVAEVKFKNSSWYWSYYIKPKEAQISISGKDPSQDYMLLAFFAFYFSLTNPVPLI